MILITGGAGYLGSVLVEMLLSHGNKVTVLDNFMWRQNSLAHLCHHKDLTIVRGDARDEKTVLPLAVNADLIIPLAALVGAPLCDADHVGSTTTNYGAIKMLCDAMRSVPIIIPISNSGYGIGEAGKECTEETPMRPISHYGRTKVMAEEEVMSRGNAVSLRLATVFGASPRMRTDLLVNDFVYRAHRDRAVVLFEGHFKRNYIHVQDVARAFCHAMLNFDKMKDQAYNVGLSDANLSKVELCERIKLVYGSFTYLEAPIGEDPDKRDYIVSNAKIEATGFKPTHSLDDGIIELKKLYAMLRNERYGNV